MSSVTGISSDPDASSQETFSKMNETDTINVRRSQSINQTENESVKPFGKRLSRATVLLAHPMGIAIMVVWVISCEGALFLNILADVFQNQAPAFPLIPTIATSVALNIFCAILSALIGRWTLRHFHLYQPFAGGQTFIVMQGLGCGILVITSIILVMYLEAIHNDPGKQIYGALTVLGCLSTLAVVTLVVSLLFFEPSRQRRRQSRRSSDRSTTVENNLWWRNLSTSPNGEVALVVCFCFVILGCSLVAVYFPAVRSSVATINGLFLVLGIITIHFVIGYNYTPGYRLFSPNAGTARMSFIQAFGWFLAFTTFQFDLILYKTGVSSPTYWHVLGGLSSVISLCILLFFVCAHRFKPLKQSGESVKREYGPLIFTLVCSFQAAIVWCVALMLSSEQFQFDLKLQQGMITCQTFTSLLCFIFPPCTHLLCRTSLGKAYEVWSPLKGPKKFLALQVVGWCCFGSSIFFAALQITEHHFHFLVIQSSLAAIAQGCIHASLYFFAESRKASLTTGQFPPHSMQCKKSPSREGVGDELLQANDTIQTNPLCDDDEEGLLREPGDSALVTVLNGEMLIAILLCTFGILVRVLIDVAARKCDEKDYFLYIPKNALLTFATIISFVVVPVAHVSCRKRISVFIPFVGCGGYVAMQSIGWMLYAMNLIIVIANGFIGKRKSLLLPTMDDRYFFFEYTVEGLIVAIPFVCIILGAFFEANAQALKTSLHERSRVDVRELRHLLQRSISCEEELRHAETLLKAIAGPLWQESPVTDGARLVREEEEINSVRQDAAKHIVVILSIAGFLAFMSAAFLAERQPVFTLVFGVAGMIITTVSCVSVHYVYGAFLYRASGRYSFFMPFAGGPTFITLQSLGWGFYAASLLLILMSCVEFRGSAVVFATTGIFSVAAQCCILNSVPHFDPTLRARSVCERNAEGIVALLTLVGSFAFSMAHDMYTHGGNSKTASSLLPMTVSAVSLCFAIPLGLVSLKRQSHTIRFSPFSVFEDTLNFSESDELSSEMIEEEEGIAGTPTRTSPQEQNTPHMAQEVQPSSAQSIGAKLSDSFSVRADILARNHWRSASDSLHVLSFMIASAVAIVLTLLLPFALVYIGYCSLYSGLNTLRIVFKSFYTLLGTFALSVLVPMLLSPSAQGISQKSIKRRIYVHFCCFLIYSVPTLIVGIPLSAPILLQTTGSWAFMSTMIVMSCISTIPYIHIVTTLANVCCAGYLLHYHIYFCLIKRHADFIAWEFVSDMVLTIIWVWYFRRYVGQPHITGRLMSSSILNVFKTWLWEGIEEYFSLRVVVDGRNGGELDSSFVDMRNPENQYIFAFHPHGVFPGTAIWAPTSQLWEETVGCNKIHRVTTHCADVVFSVPFMRDLVMGINGMSVTRRGIENSLSQGNSPLIVTGGLAEMLLTKISDTEMHLVAYRTGFIRMALLEKVPLVPIICFAEQNVWGNVELPWIQRYTRRVLGFPFPTLPYGRWYLPLPTQRPLMVVVGRPVLPEPGMNSAESAEHLERYRQRYNEELTKLFLKYRAEAGYPNMSLVLHHHKEVTRVD